MADSCDAVRQIHDTVHDDKSSPAELLDALTALRELQEELASWEPRLIGSARAAGISWAELAPALGVTSRQAAERRYLRVQPRAGGEPTKEGRVRAERTRRAGDRAVQDWARENSASLRHLAGRVGALDGLDRQGRRSAGRVQDALGGDDAAELLEPLSDAQRHLTTGHSALAAEIEAVASKTAAVRRDTERRRSKQGR